MQETPRRDMLSQRVLAFLLVACLLFPLSGCDPAMPEGTNQTIAFENGSGAVGCMTADRLVFFVNYANVQFDLELDPGGVGFGIVKVLDQEQINVQVRRDSNNELLADRTITVPEDPDNDNRRITYCNPFNLVVSNF